MPLSVTFSFTLTFSSKVIRRYTSWAGHAHSTQLASYQLSYKTLIGINSAPSPNGDQGTWHANSIWSGGCTKERHRAKSSQTKPNTPTDRPNEQQPRPNKNRNKTECGMFYFGNWEYQQRSIIYTKLH